jgi:predicted secreted protein
LLLGGADPVRLGLAVVGIFFILWLVVVTVLLDLKIRSLLEQLEQREGKEVNDRD